MRLVPALQAVGDTWHHDCESLEGDVFAGHGFDWLISFGYRHKIRMPWLAHFGSRAINLHTSILPWNRGAHPNFWSWIEGTPKGVTLHIIDEGIDTGPIIVARGVPLSPRSTFSETYRALNDAAVALFADKWHVHRETFPHGLPQKPGTGSRHLARELRTDLLPLGWNTVIADALTASRIA